MTEHSKLITAGLDISTFIDSIEDYAVFILDTAGIIRTWNRGAMRIKGYQRDEIVGRSFAIFYPEEDLLDNKPAWELVEAERVGRFEDEGWRIRKDGSRFWANVVITAARDQAGKLQGFVKVTRDLTQRREREQRLRDEQAARAAVEATAKRLTVLQSISEVSLKTLDLQGLLEELVSRIHATIDVDAVTVLLHNAAKNQLVPTASRGLVRDLVNAVPIPFGRGIAGRIAATRAPLVVPDLSRVEVFAPELQEQMRSLAGVPLLADGVLLGILHFATRAPRAFSEQDVTQLRLIGDLVAAAIQRARTHAALSESERRFRATFDHAAVGVAQVGLDGRWLRVNERLCSMLGYSAEELLTRTFQSITHPDDLAEDLDHLTRLVEGAIDSYTLPKRYFTRKGHAIWIQLTVSLVRDDDGFPAYAIAVIEDISARKRAEEESERLLAELRDALSARDRFLSIASHELRTPLTTLKLQSRLLTGSRANAAEPSIPPHMAPRLNVMARQVDRLIALVEQLLDVTRIHEGRLQLRVEEVDLGGLVTEVVERFEEQATQAMTTIDVTVREPVTGQWDRLRLDQVLTNLVSNAIKYGGGKPISIFAEGDDERARVVVADQGIGIREEDRGRLFCRFERFAADPTIGGMGLGLWITREIVSALGGTIRVESELGRGTTFVVELPRQSPTDVDAPSIAA